MTISSPDFAAQGEIPSQFTCEGPNISPTLEIADVPTGTASLALVMEDPDAPGRTWQHWLAWNIPPETRRIEPGQLPATATSGINDFGQAGYGGPCPPSGTHRYIFRLYALKASLLLDPAADRAQLDQAMANRIIAESELVGRFGHH